MVAHCLLRYIMGRAQLLYMRHLSRAFLVLLITVPCVVLHCTATHHSREDRHFEIQHDTFVKDKQPLQIISGRQVTHTPCRSRYCAFMLLRSQPSKSPCGCCSFHYYRITPAYWEDRLLRAKALGLNTIQVSLLHSRLSLSRQQQFCPNISSAVTGSRSTCCADICAMEPA